MQLPKGFDLANNKKSKAHALQLLKNIYGLKQAESGTDTFTEG